MTPFEVRREKFGEVVKLTARIRQKNMRQQNVSTGDKVWRDKNGDLHIRRKATNDNWY